MKSSCVYFLSAIILTCAVPSALAQTPELPRVYLDTTYPTQTGTIRNVAQGQSVQDAIDAAVPGDTIVLQAGALFTEQITLKRKSNPSSKWIVIRSSSTAFDPGGTLAPGTRVNGASTAHTSQMARIRGIGNNATPIQTEWNPANPQAVTHYRLVGLDVAPSDTFLVAVIELGSPSATTNSASDMVVDRCYVHGLDDPAGHYRRGIALQGSRMAVIDSDVSNFHTPNQPEAQSIVGWNGAGPFKIVNNFLEAAGENVLFGGATPAENQLVPSDIEIRRNLFTKRTAWQNRTAYSVKNLFELKAGRRILLEGNILENSWPDEQFYAIVLTPVSSGGCTWCVVEDITVRHNLIRHAVGGVNIASVNSAGPSRRIAFVNNLWDDINPAAYGHSGSTKFMQLLSGPEDVIFEHNTVINYTSNAVYFDQSPAALGFVFRDNLIRRGTFGVNGGGSSEGDALALYAPDAIFVENAIAGVPSDRQDNYPLGNLFPSYAEFEDAFANYNAGSGGNYELDPAPNYYSQRGNPDIGADIDAINAAINGTAPPPPETVLVADNFNDNALSGVWVEGDLWSGVTDPAVPVNEANQRLEVGPIPNQPDGTTYNGIRSTTTHNFTNGYTQVRVAQAASSQAYTMFAVGINSSNYYRFYIFAGTLVCEQRINGQKTALFTTTYNSANHQFLRIEHTGGKVVFLAAPNNLGAPGQWVTLHNTQTWDTSAVPPTAVMFELKAGISGADPSAGSAYFDDFRAARR